MCLLCGSELCVPISNRSETFVFLRETATFGTERKFAFGEPLPQAL